MKPLHFALGLTATGVTLLLGMTTTVGGFLVPALALGSVPVILLAGAGVIDYAKARSHGVWGNAALMWLAPHTSIFGVYFFFFALGVIMALAGVR
jgi:hypothetical protein